MIDYLREENRVLRGGLRGKRLRLFDDGAGFRRERSNLANGTAAGASAIKCWWLLRNPLVY